MWNPFDDEGDSSRSVDGIGIAILKESRGEDVIHVFIIHALAGNEDIISPLAHWLVLCSMGGEAQDEFLLEITVQNQRLIRTQLH